MSKPSLTTGRVRRLFGFLFVLGCEGGVGRTYNNNDLELSTAHRAQALCSCLFVMKQTDDFCARWSVDTPDLTTFQVNKNDKVVTAQAALLWGIRARFVDPKFGCILE